MARLLALHGQLRLEASRYLDRSVLKDEIISTIEEAEKILSHWRPEC